MLEDGLLVSMPVMPLVEATGGLDDTPLSASTARAWIRLDSSVKFVADVRAISCPPASWRNRAARSNSDRVVSVSRATVFVFNVAKKRFAASTSGTFALKLMLVLIAILGALVTLLSSSAAVTGAGFFSVAVGAARVSSFSGAGCR